MDHCCPNSGPSTYGTLRECVNQQNRTMMIIAIVIGGTVGMIVLILIVIWLKRKIISKYGTFGNFIANCCKGGVEPMEKVEPIILTDRIAWKS